MNKKGFTLVELIAVIVILAMLSLLAFPPILKSIRDSKGKISDANKEILYQATSLYVSNNPDIFPLKKENKYCVTVKDLSDSEVLPNKIYDIDGKELNENNKISVQVFNGQYHYEYDNNCESLNGPNEPELFDNMVPIYYNGTNWIYADKNDEWYNYTNKQWANAVVLNNKKNPGDIILENDIDLWFVWIPRYKYQLFNHDPINQEIKIKFENGIDTTGTVRCHDTISGVAGSPSEKCENDTVGNWYTHPAFTFGKGNEDAKELTGIWVSKFEISGTIDKITIKPNQSSFSNNHLSILFNEINHLSLIYNINQNSHMIKNMEWGAVAYLSQSKYGKGINNIYINNNLDRITGIAGDKADSDPNRSTIYRYDTQYGNLASTTQNIYGLFDMSGGNYEYVMGTVSDETGQLLLSNSFFKFIPNDSFYDFYNFNNNPDLTKSGKYGDATKETIAWYNDSKGFAYNNFNWFLRGGKAESNVSAGIFAFNAYDGVGNPNFSSRAVLIKK